MRPDQRAVLAHHPSLLAGQVLVALVPDPLGGTIGDPDAPTGEAGGERTLGALAPAHHLPVRVREHRLGGLAELVGDVSLARASSSGDWEDHRDVDRVDLQVAWNAHGPSQPSRAQALAEGSAEPVTRVRQNAAEPHAGGLHAVDLLERDLGLAPEAAPLGWHASLSRRAVSDVQLSGRNSLRAIGTGASYARTWVTTV